jgi:hemerythrin superfamily protein
MVRSKIPQHLDGEKRLQAVTGRTSGKFKDHERQGTMGSELERLDIRKIEEFIKSLDEKDLVTLNKMIVSRVKLLREMELLNQMTRFIVGDHVTFCDSQGFEQHARVKRINRKTVTVITSEMREWNVHPALLTLK